MFRITAGLRSFFSPNSFGGCVGPCSGCEQQRDCHVGFGMVLSTTNDTLDGAGTRDPSPKVQDTYHYASPTLESQNYFWTRLAIKITYNHSGSFCQNWSCDPILILKISLLEYLDLKLAITLCLFFFYFRASSIHCIYPTLVLVQSSCLKI